MSLADIGDRIPGDVFSAWAEYVIEYDRLAPLRKEQADHDATMAAFAAAAR